jgi:HKD family nuclease
MVKVIKNILHFLEDCKTRENKIIFLKTGGKEFIMRRRTFYRWIFLPLLFLFLFSLSNVEAKKKVELVGKETLNFTLPSAHDRLINYAEEYYGKYHLIITFFPAAFTPI